MRTFIPFIVAGSAGVGKTTLASMLLDGDPELTRSISYTTRKPRPGEEDGVSYHFVSEEVFRKMVDDGKFLEHATVYGNFYGTALGSVKAALLKSDVLLVLDIAGCESLRRAIPETCVIYLVPPNLKDLEARLKRRASESEASMKNRLKSAAEEIAAGLKLGDFVVINDDLSKTLFDLVAIIRASKLKTADRSVIAKMLEYGEK